MPNQSYYPNREGDQLTFFTNIQSKIAQYYTTLDITPARQTKLTLTLEWLIWAWQTYLPARRQDAPAATAWRNNLASGISDASTDTTPPMPAPVTEPVSIPYYGMVTWLVQEIARWKGAEGYTVNIGQDLGIIGPQQSGPDFGTLQPVLALAVEANVVQIGWGWQGFSANLDMLEIQVDRADGKGWVFLTYDSTPNYTDTTPLPATPAKWKYRAIYRVGDAQVGLWSLETGITVGG